MEHLEERRRAVRVRLKIAQQNWERACIAVSSTEAMHLNREIQSPDGLQGLRNARLEMGLAGAQYRQILQEFAEIVLREPAQLHAAPKMEGD